VTVQGADQGDTTTIAATVTAAAEDLEAVATATDGQTAVIDEAVTAKGYHSNQVLVDLAALDLRTYIAEPDRGRRHWKKNAPPATQCMRLGDGSMVPAGSPCCGDEASGWNGRTRISMKPAVCDARICGATPTS
jgi:hypothetical protein